MKTIRIGNDINVVWKIFSRNGMKFSLEGKILRLWLMSGPFKKEITDYEVALRNEIHFFIDADDLHRLGVYKILLSVLDNQAETEDASFDVTEVFQLVSRSYFSTENQILDGKDIFLIVQSILTDAYTSPLEGASAYEIAVKHGYVGTEEEWVASLKGDIGEIGPVGKSAYQSAVDNGFEGTEAEWVYLMTKASRDMSLVEQELEDVVHHVDAGSLEDLEDPSAYATRDEFDELRIKIDGMSTGKYYGFHVSEEDLPEATDPGYAYVGESAPYALWNFDGLEWKDSGVTVDNAPTGNGEDISTDESGMLKFADRAYNPEEPNGMGYVILRKDKSFAEQLTMTHTIYEIRYDFDLDGEEVTIPEGCTLKFEGGTIANGALIGVDTIVDAPSVKCFSLDCALSGTWVGDASSEWFGLVPDCILDENEQFVSGTDNTKGFANLFLFADVSISPGIYYTAAEIQLKTGQTVRGNGATIKAQYETKYQPLFTINADNVVLSNLNLIGWKQESSETTEFAHGISIRGRHVVIENVSIRCFRGDGIYVATSEISETGEVLINNTVAVNNHRQGLSVTRANGLTVTNCEFSNTSGTAPQAGIDVEPNSGDSCKNIRFDNIVCNGNAGSAILLDGSNGVVSQIRVSRMICDKSVSLRTVSDINVSDFYISVSVGDGFTLQDSTIKNLTISDGIICGNNASQDGIFFLPDSDGPENINIRNVEIYGFASYGIQDVNNAKVDGFSLSDVYVHHCYNNIKLTSTGMLNVRAKNVRDANKGYKTDGTQYDGWTFGWGRQIATDVKTLIDYDRTNSGTTANRPATSSQYRGLAYFDTDLGHMVWSNGSKYIDAFGNAANLKKKGATSDRPNASTAGAGFTFFDTTLGKMIVSNGTDWVNMDGSLP